MAYDPFTHRKKIPDFPSVFGSPLVELQNDPARRKGSFVSRAGGVDPTYARDSLAFNKILAKPRDRWTAEERAVVYGPAKAASPTGWQGPSAPVAPGNFTSQYGTASLSFAPGQKQIAAQPFVDQPVPEMPASGAQGDTGASGGEFQPIPDLPANGAFDPPILQSEGYVPGMPSDYRAPAMNDGQHASRLMSDLDEINKLVDSINVGGEGPDITTENQWADHEREYMSPIGSRPPGAWNTPFNNTGTADWGTRGAASPAPVQFNNTSSDQWGSTAMGEGRYKPRAESTQRYYERAAGRGNQGRVNRLSQRTRPGAPYAQ